MRNAKSRISGSLPSPNKTLFLSQVQTMKTLPNHKLFAAFSILFMNFPIASPPFPQMNSLATSIGSVRCPC